MAEIKMKLLIPVLPNFIRISGTDDGGDSGPRVAVEKIDEKTLREIAEEWTEALIQHAKDKRD